MKKLITFDAMFENDDSLLKDLRSLDLGEKPRGLLVEISKDPKISFLGGTGRTDFDILYSSLLYEFGSGGKTEEEWRNFILDDTGNGELNDPNDINIERINDECNKFLSRIPDKIMIRIFSLTPANSEGMKTSVRKLGTIYTDVDDTPHPMASSAGSECSFLRIQNNLEDIEKNGNKQFPRFKEELKEVVKSRSAW